MANPYDDLMAAAIILTSGQETASINAQTAAIEAAGLANELALDSINTNNIAIAACEHAHKNAVDIASGILAVATYLIYDKYYDKYKEVLDWRDEIATKIKACLELDIDHFIGTVMGQMNSAINDIFNAPTVSVSYAEIIERYNNYANDSSSAALALIDEIENKTCDKDRMECDFTEDDLKGWAVAATISAADGRARFDEARVPRRLDLLSRSLDAAHSSTFRLPDFDYQALSNAANLASSLATAYAGIANSALGSFGYFSANFVNSLGGR